MDLSHRERERSDGDDLRAEATSSISRLSDVGLRTIQGEWTIEKESDRTKATSDVRVIGDPKNDAAYWHWQSRDGTCAVVAQEGIINKHTGEGVTEEALIDEAQAKGWLRSDGTLPADVGKLLELRGFVVQRFANANTNQLRDEVRQGHDVVAAVDAGYLWQSMSDVGIGHAVWVTSVEIDQNDNVTAVFLNDSGRIDDGGDRIPVEQFGQAWSQRMNYMMTAQQPEKHEDEGGM